jgi:Tfp pilus assembly PilM family ATPase
MIGKFIGVDLDGSKIRLCVIKRGFRKTELIRFIDIDIPEDGQSITDLLSHHLKKESVKTDIAVSIPSSPVSMRILSFPFNDVKKIDQVYSFELENASTLRTDDKINSYHVVSGKDGGADALVCMFKKEEVADTLAIFEEGGVSPRIITYSPFALHALSDHFQTQRPFVLLSIGQVATNFTLFDENGLTRVRSSSAGLESIINKYSELSGLDTKTSTQKVLRGFTGADDKVLRQAFTFLFSEIKKTLKFFEFDSKKSIEKVILAGDASTIPGVVDQLEQDINKDVRLVNIADLGEQKSAVYLNSYALALYGSEAGSGKLNFRKDEYKFTSKDEETRKALLVPAMLFCSLFFLILIRNGINYIRVNSEIKRLNGQIESSVKEVFPEVKVLPRPVEYMENQVKKVSGELGLIEGIKSGKTPLDIMRNLSTIIPSRSSVTFDELNFTDDLSLRLKGRSKSYDDIAKVEKALNDSGIFEKVVRSSAGSALDKIKFEISLVIK